MPPSVTSARRGSVHGRASEPLPTGAEKLRAVRHMFDDIAGRYDLLNAIMTFGMDRGWRRRCLDALDLPTGSKVLDVACGTGDLCRELRSQAQHPVGLDMSTGMLSHAHTTAPLVLADALASPFRPACFDGAVSGFALRNVVDLGALFAELARTVRPGGRISLLDLCEPEVPVLRLGHRLWSEHAVPLFGSLLSDASAYRYLPRSLAYLPPADEVVRLLEIAGFAAVERDLLSGGICQLYTATRIHETNA